MSRYPETREQKEFKAQIGKRIRQARLEAGMSTVELGDLTGMGAGNVSGYESGRKGWTAWTLVKFAEALGTPAGEFLP